MMQRLIRDEAGMTMGLAVIMILLISVMGAGLLTFVQRDLDTVIEVNQGQEAVEMADAGVEAAKAELNLDARIAAYNGGVDTADSQWSCVWNGTTCTGTGKTLNIDGNQVNVKIQYLTPTPSGNPELASSPSYAPEVLPSGASDYPSNRNYFRVIARGVAGDARRVVEAVYRIRETGMPTAYHSTGDIDFSGNAFTIKNVSVFSQEDVTGFRPSNLTGCDVAYGDWNRPPWNTKARTAGATTCTRSDGSTFTGVPTGVGAEGVTSYASPSGTRPGTVDYDNYDGGGAGTTVRPDFVPNTWTATGDTQDTNDITYPFDPDPNTQIDLDLLRAAAASGRDGSKLVTKGPGQSHSLNDYPSNSTSRTVYFVEFANADGTFTVPGSNPVTGVAKGSVSYTANATNTNGTIVIVNGDFSLSPSAPDYRGIIVLRDPVDTDNITMNYTNSGNHDVQGFANVEGEVTISGDADTATPDDLTSATRPGFYTMERWSWRECYSVTCS